MLGCVAHPDSMVDLFGLVQLLSLSLLLTGIVIPALWRGVERGNRGLKAGVHHFQPLSLENWHYCSSDIWNT